MDLYESVAIYYIVRIKKKKETLIQFRIQRRHIK